MVDTPDNAQQPIWAYPIYSAVNLPLNGVWVYGSGYDVSAFQSVRVNGFSVGGDLLIAVQYASDAAFTAPGAPYQIGCWSGGLFSWYFPVVDHYCRLGYIGTAGQTLNTIALTGHISPGPVTGMAFGSVATVSVNTTIAAGTYYDQYLNTYCGPVDVVVQQSVSQLMNVGGYGYDTAGAIQQLWMSAGITGTTIHQTGTCGPYCNRLRVNNSGSSSASFWISISPST